MQAVAASSVSEAEKQAAAEKIVNDNPLIFRQQSTEMPDQNATTVDGVIRLLEERFFEEAAELAPDEESRKKIEEASPLREIEVEPLRPILIARRTHRSKIVVTRNAEQQGYTPWWKNTAKAEEQVVAKIDPKVEESSPEKDAEEVVKVEFLADEQVTAEMHDDTTVLRNVENDEGDLVLFDALHLWVGGSGQFDAAVRDGLFRYDKGGDRQGDFEIRRAEGILRVSLMDLGELKLQYDFDSTVFRDLYWRWVSGDESQNVTIGNQKETLGLDYLMGNKFGTAMERSAPASAFGSYRSKGVRYSRAFNFSPEKSLLQVWGENETFLTTSVGAYTKDIENSHETDWALTGRVTGGAQRGDNSGLHLGVSGSYREGDFTGVAGRPELHEASRIQLASFEAEQQAVVGLEGMYSKGSLHSQVELYYSDYRGGSIDGKGFGGYAQVGWFLSDHQRRYRARSGLWAPVNTGSGHVFEIFSRVSYTRGEDDNHTWNALRILTLGGSWYYRQLRGSLNLLLAETRRDLEDEGVGNAFTARIQYLF